MRYDFTVALMGNPNSGKTTLFNKLTGGRQHVGNYPGVTVEKKEGVARRDGSTISVVDLPGTYSLTAYSIDEVVARDFLLWGEPDVVVYIVNALISHNCYSVPATVRFPLGTHLWITHTTLVLQAGRAC